MGNCFSNSLSQDATCTQITYTCTSSSLGGFEAEMAEVFLRLHDEATEENKKNHPDAWKNMHYDDVRRCWVEGIVAGADGGVGDSATCADAGDGVGADAPWDCAGCGGGDSVGADAPWDCAGTSAGCGGAFSAVGASCDTDGVDANAPTILWDGLNLACHFKDGKVPIMCKAEIRKTIRDKHKNPYKHGPLTNPVLQAIRSGYLAGDNKEILLTAWKNPIPPVLMCLIADIFHECKHKKELGPLPDFYIPLQKQNHPHPQKVKELKIGEFVVCNICEDRRGGCKCCTICRNPNGKCTCKCTCESKECTKDHHICDECGLRACDCMCGAYDWLWT
jgi:hypothetical protein